MNRLTHLTSSRAARVSGGSPRFRGRLNWRSAAAVFAAGSTVALLSGTPIAGASGPTYKNYTVTVSPKAILSSNNPTPISVNLGNEISSNTSFGSAELTVNAPAGVAVSQTLTLPKTWSAKTISTNPNVILLTSTKSGAIAPGSTLTVGLTITPSTAGTVTFVTEVKQSNDFSGTGNDFNYDSANSSNTIEIVNSVTLAFHQQPSNVQQSVSSTSTFHYMCPPVSVLATAPDGTPVGGVTVTLSNNGPGDPGLVFSPASLSSGATSDSNGLATFGSADCSSGIGGTNLGSGYTLIAGSSTPSGAVSSPASTPFAVVQMLITCTTNPCKSPTITGQSGTQGNVTSTFGTPGYQLGGSFGGTALVCDGQVTTTPGDVLVIEATVGASGVITMTFPKSVVNNLANNGTPLMQVCAGASAQFPGSTDQGSTVVPEWQGLVQNCPTNYQSVPNELCVLSRSKNAANETIQIFSADLSDPSYW